MTTTMMTGVCLYCGTEGTVLDGAEAATLIPDRPNTLGYRCRAGCPPSRGVRISYAFDAPPIPITDEQIAALATAVGAFGVELARPLNQLLTALRVNRASLALVGKTDAARCAVTATIGAVTRRCGNEAGHVGDCWFLPAPAPREPVCGDCDGEMVQLEDGPDDTLECAWCDGPGSVRPNVD